MLMDSNEAQYVDTRTLQPAGIGHPNIEHHDVECRSPQRLERLIQSSRRSYDEPFARKKSLQRIAHDRFIIDDEDPCQLVTARILLAR